MAYGQIKSLEDWRAQTRASISNFGDSNPSRVHYKIWLDKYKRDLAEQESWLQTNPANTIRQANVARLRRQVEEYQGYYNSCGRNDSVFNEIKNTALKSDDGGLYPIHDGMIDKAWGFCRYGWRQEGKRLKSELVERICTQEEFENFFTRGDMKILSRKYEVSGSNFVWEDGRETFKLIMCHAEDKEYDEVFEVGFNGYMKKLSDEEVASLQAEKRNNERKEAEKLKLIRDAEERERVKRQETQQKSSEGAFVFAVIAAIAFVVIIIVAGING